MGCLAFILIFLVLYGFTINVGTGIAFLILLILLFGIMISIGTKHEAKQNEKFSVTKAKIEDEFKANEFNASQSIYSCDHTSMLAIDENSKRISFVRTKGVNFIDNNDFVIDTYSYKDLLESHILEDGVSTTKTSRTSQIGGALIGGLLVGGVGALIGGLSGKKKTAEEVKSVKLQIVVNDTKKPVQEISFLKQKVEVKKDNPLYEQALVDATHWHKLISVLIKQADQEDKVMNAQTNIELESGQKQNTYIHADEIRKLHDLFKEGIITEEEFDIQKKKIISE
ncbi:SHOCT domain-containing protein [Halalkalibacter krulwichiae]|uniref:SHOCT domain-containing protein n=1 Tax=Halalkalibacter krulwichiae TaxID=199441 RepID=A0A1X9MKY1_9BACI|nr:SHOCT domain-containing protein [Halalkalibacter krulwichiae]ARK32401.1 hypothetical protein BkAM31D_22475 [Halalkalibacter krulwichiae]